MTPIPSFQDLLGEFAEDIFIGREEQIRLFERALKETKPPFLILDVSGQGGVGKTTLLERFQRIAAANDTPSVKVDEEQSNVLEVLSEMARQFSEQSYSFSKFEERYKTYRTIKEQVEADPKAPKGMLDFAVRGLMKVGIRSMRRVPVAGDMADVFLSPEAEERIVEEGSNFASYVAQKFTNKDERVLLLESNAELTRYFLSDLNRYAEARKFVLCFDTYEKTSPILDQWLRDLIEGKFGRASGNLRIVIAGRFPLGQPWTQFRRAIQQVELNPFTETEAHNYLKESGIDDEETIQLYLRLSERLPVLLALLVSSPSEVKGELSADAVERFLQGLESDAREAALQASLPRFFNRDVLLVLLGDEIGKTTFEWLSNAHFVRQRSEGWVYHDVVRPLLLRYMRRRSERQVNEVHQHLADYYEKQAQLLNLSTAQQRQDSQWRIYELESLYHRLSFNSPTRLSKLLSALLLNLRTEDFPDITNDKFRQLLSNYSVILKQVAQESGEIQLQSWSNDFETCKQQENYLAVRNLFQRICTNETLEALERSVAYTVLAGTYRKNDNQQQKITFLGKAIELQPRSNYNYFKIGIAHNEMKSYEAALANFSKAIELQPEDGDNYQWRGLTHYDMKSYEAALADLGKAIELKPEDSFNYYWRGLTHYRIKSYEAALADLGKAIELKPSYDFNYFVRGITHYQIKSYEAALADFGKAIELQPEASNHYHWRGRTHYEMSSYQAALTDLNRAIELEPEYGNHYHRRGIIYFETRKYDFALVDFTKAIGLSSDKGNSYGWRGSTYFELKQYEMAVKDFTSAIQLLPNDDALYQWRGRSYLELEKYDAAIDDFTIAIQINPTDDDFAWRGAAYYDNRQYKTALTDYSKAIELSTNNAAIYSERALTHFKLNQLQRALTDFNDAIKLGNSDPISYAGRAIVYFMLGELEKAESDLNQVNISLEKRSRPAYIVAAGYATLGDADETCRWLRRALERDSELVREVEKDPDFDKIRENEKFTILLLDFKTE